MGLSMHRDDCRAGIRSLRVPAGRWLADGSGAARFIRMAVWLRWMVVGNAGVVAKNHSTSQAGFPRKAEGIGFV